jgi:hypothetical protein
MLAHMFTISSLLGAKMIAPSPSVYQVNAAVSLTFVWLQLLLVCSAGVNGAVGQKFDRCRDALVGFGGYRRSTLLFLRKLAPQVGLEPTTKRLIPISRDSTAELYNP